MNPATTTNTSKTLPWAVLVYAPAWIALCLSIYTLIANQIASSATDQKIARALSLAETAIARSEISKLGDPYIAELETTLVIEKSQFPSPNDNSLIIRNLGGDAIHDVGVGWEPMFRPIPKEMPDAESRRTVVAALSSSQVEHSKLSSKLLAADETARILSLPDVFRLCYSNPGIKFYGQMRLQWRHRLTTELPKGKEYWYQVFADDQGRLHITVSEHFWIRGMAAEFEDRQLGLGFTRRI